MSAAPAATSAARLLAVVRGRVQGVGFRFTTREEAAKLGLAGWVRNRSDGAVEVVAEGPRPDLGRLLGFLRAGPRTAHVVGVDEVWGPAEGEEGPFSVRDTV